VKQIAKFLVLGLVAYLGPARSGVARADGFLNVTLQKEAVRHAPPEGVSADLGPVEVVKTLWLAPSVGLDVFSLDTTSKEYRAGLIPGVGYGLKWKPSGWTLTDAVLSLDLFVQANLLEPDDEAGSKFFAVDALPIVTVIDWVSVGFGPSVRLSLTDGIDDTTHWIFSFGVRKAI
jgi:hypothetical protein